jgi:hypothetical protein
VDSPRCGCSTRRGTNSSARCVTGWPEAEFEVPRAAPVAGNKAPPQPKAKEL